MKQLTKIINPLGQEKLFYYDLNKNLARTVDAEGQTIDYTYDEVNRLIQKQLPDNLYTYSYDLVDNLTRLVENDSDLNFAYDMANRLIQTKTGATIAQPATTISYTYGRQIGDKINKLSMTDPKGEVTNYTYDALNRLTSLTNPQSQTTTYTYDQLSRTRKHFTKVKCNFISSW